jgi:hypothetical protein
MGRSAPPVSVGRVKAQAYDGAPEQQQTVTMDWMVINNDFATGFSLFRLPAFAYSYV